ncbi:MAG: hypothetical protein WDM79_02655 [Terricaulis sp.]
MQGIEKRASARGGVARWAGTISFAALLAAIPALAMAQSVDSEPAPEEEIIVTGIRAGLQSSSLRQA